MQTDELLKQMTLREKLAQLSQFDFVCLDTEADGTVTGPAAEFSLSEEDVAAVGSVLNFIGVKNMRALQEKHLSEDRNKIPMLFMQDVVHGAVTLYPIPLAIGASFDKNLAEECSRMAAKEAALAGIHVTFAPMLDLVRDPRWGRCMESTGEDPYLNGIMGRAMVNGFQGDHTEKYKIVSCIKHFAAYGMAEAGRDYNSADMSEYTLRNFYLPAYKEALNAGAKMVMTSFNTLNGVPSSGNKKLVKGILREEWGFDGVVISDYNAFREMIVHGYCESEKDAAEKAMCATSDIEMMSSCYIKEIPLLIEEGKITKDQVDEAVARVLRLKESAGIFKNPFGGADEDAFLQTVLCSEHRKLARIAAEKCCVLLKNENILPFSAESSKIAVIGPFSKTGTLGAWACYGREEDAVSVVDGIQNAFPYAEIYCEAGCGDEVNAKDCSGIPKAVEVAQKSDCVILCIGERSDMSGEGNSRAELRLSLAQQRLIKEVAAVNSRTVAVLFCGRPLVLSDIINDVPAFVVAWQTGTEGGNALANLLFGKVNFSAKLPMTFPRSEGQIPIYYNCCRTGRPKPDDNYEGEHRQGYCSQYLDMKNAPLFPFGYGLSYTKFAISLPELSSDRLNRNEYITVSCTVKNIGKTGGEEVVQMYICDEVASRVRPIKELKGFRKIFLQAGEEKEVVFTLSEKDLQFFSDRNLFEAESGYFTVWVSDSSDVKEGVRFYLE